MKIPFCQLTINDDDINNVIAVLKSGWITTGIWTSKFEENLSNYCKVDNIKCISSATAGIEIVLKSLNIGVGDEVITSPFTYTASASSSINRGATLVFADIEKNSFLIDIDDIIKKITPETKVITPIDFAGIPFKYDELKKKLQDIKREDIFIVADSAHSLGAMYNNQKIGGQADIHIFSFQAVKNLTTGEGGAIAFNNSKKLGINFFRKISLQTLQGQNKDALKKNSGMWEYDIETLGLKYNMTDITASIGISQLARYAQILEERKKICQWYSNLLSAYEYLELPNLF